MGTSTFNRIKGRGGRTLTEKWETEGTRTFLGLHTRGFPNLFIVTGPQGGGGSFNFTDVIYAHADYLIWMMQTMRERGASVVDVRKEPEDKYAEHCRVVDIATAPLRDCISYYNGEGKAECWFIVESAESIAQSDFLRHRLPLPARCRRGPKDNRSRSGFCRRFRDR